MSATDLRAEAERIQDAIVALLAGDHAWPMLQSLRARRRRLLLEAADKEAVRR